MLYYCLMLVSTYPEFELKITLKPKFKFDLRLHCEFRTHDTNNLSSYNSNLRVEFYNGSLNFSSNLNLILSSCQHLKIRSSVYLPISGLERRTISFNLTKSEIEISLGAQFHRDSSLYIKLNLQTSFVLFYFNSLSQSKQM